jgi:undecaprenyl-diphosphatase
MPLWHLLLLASVQGVTEFLPVSSSGHLALLPAVTGLEDQGLFLDVMVHVGTLAAVVLYFRGEVARALRGTAELLRGRRRGPDARLALGLAVATVPVMLAGLALHALGWDAALRSVAVIGWATLGFGVLLWIADRRGAQRRGLADWGLRDALVMGLWQAVALIPGASRSGVCITGARALGYERREAARIAMLMSIPTILASGTLLSLDLLDAPDAAARASDGLIAALLACLAALAALHLMMRLLERVSFTPYVLYRLALGSGLLLWAYS